MTLRTLIRRSLRFHWRSHLGVVLGAAVGSAALIGALVVGDSVRASLREQAFARMGNIHLALASLDRFFRADLADEIQTTLRDHDSRPVLVVPALLAGGAVSTGDGSARVNRVQLVGVRQNFWKLAGGSPELSEPERGHVILSEPLARALGVTNGDAIIIRLPKPTALTREFAVSQRADSSVALRFTVQSVAGEQDFGSFSLQASPFAPLNAFVSLEELQSQLGQPGRANLMLVGGNPPQQEPARYDSRLRVSAESELAGHRNLADAQVELRAVTNENQIELRTARVFLDPPIVRAAQAADASANPILTYLVNLFRAGTNTAPYSMITAARAPWTPADMRDDEILVSQWLAEDLRVKPGDEIALSYFLPESGVRLVEGTNRFRVRGIVPMEMPWADRTLMPDFPGIEKAESTSDWDAGFPLVHKIRQKDEDYWKQHRGTPKAFVTLVAGQKMWSNRFGELTAIRFPVPTNGTLALTPALSPEERENRSPATETIKPGDSSTSSGKSKDGQRLSPLPGGEGQGEGFVSSNSVGTHSTASQTSPSDGDAVERVPANAPENYRTALEKKILANLKPEELGLRFEPVREQALKAAEQSQDFGGLFLGFSFFLIIAALLLMAMLFQFGLEQRMTEVGTLLALGFTPGQVRRLLLGEGVALAFIGGALGAIGGIAYARAMLHGLTTIWRDAVGSSALSFHATPQTLLIGLFASVVVSAATIWLTLRKFLKRPARELLAGEVQSPESKVRSRGRLIGGAALVAAIGLVGWTLVKGDTANAGAFFGAGALVLIAGLSFASAWLTGMERRAPPRRDGSGRSQQERAEAVLGAPITLASLAIRGCARRRKRSVATVAMLACGSFLIVSIGVFRLDANRDATERSSGTGGFALIGEATMPVVQDLNSQSGRDFFALSERELAGVNFVPFRVREGDEASCLNLNRAQKPRLLGVKAEMLEGRFTIAKGAGWASLRSSRREEAHSNSELGTRNSEQESQSLLTSAATAENEIPAIGDANSIQWAMHKKVGDTIDYVDERGQPFKVRIVGAVANSILQGSLIIDEAEFVKRFPGESGYRTFLIDAPSNSVAQVSATLSRAMQDVGLELTPAAQRLAQFNAVQNTYLGTFQVLGGLGLLLGSVGLGIVVLRNVLERRGELAVLLAVGFRKQTLQRLLLIEHGALLAAGLGIGVVAAAVAVLPSVLSSSASLPYQSLALTLAAVLANGALWTWVAARVALRGNLLAALRNE